MKPTPPSNLQIALFTEVTNSRLPGYTDSIPPSSLNSRVRDWLPRVAPVLRELAGVGRAGLRAPNLADRDAVMTLLMGAMEELPDETRHWFARKCLSELVGSTAITTGDIRQQLTTLATLDEGL